MSDIRKLSNDIHELGAGNVAQDVGVNNRGFALFTFQQRGMVTAAI